MNSGFGCGSRRIGDHKGVREGREKGGFLPVIKGVGRTGKGPTMIPKSMLRALGVKSVERCSGGNVESIESVSRDITKGWAADLNHDNLEQEIREHERLVALRAQERAMYEAVEWVCQVPHYDKAYVEKFVDEGGSPEEALRMLKRLATRVLELQRYLDDTESKVQNALNLQPMGAQMDRSDEPLSAAYFLHHRARLRELKEDITVLRLDAWRARKKAIYEEVERVCQTLHKDKVCAEKLFTEGDGSLDKAIRRREKLLASIAELQSYVDGTEAQVWNQNLRLIGSGRDRGDEFLSGKYFRQHRKRINSLKEEASCLRGAFCISIPVLGYLLSISIFLAILIASKVLSSTEVLRSNAKSPAFVDATTNHGLPTPAEDDSDHDIVFEASFKEMGNDYMLEKTIQI